MMQSAIPVLIYHLFPVCGFLRPSGMTMAEPENHGNWLVCAMTIVWAWSTLIFFVRVWAKVTAKRWGAEDYTVSVAFLVSTMDIVAIMSAIHRGYGLPMDLIAREDQLSLYAGQQLYIFISGLSKVSTALFVIHLAYSGPQNRPGYVLVGVSAIWTIGSMLVIALRGDPRRPWQTLVGTKTMYFRWIVVETTGLIVEIMLVLLSVSLVGSLQLKAQKRLVILSAFAARLLLIPLVAVRLWLLSPGVNTGSTDTSIAPSIITQFTLHFSVLSASITSLRPFLRTFHMDYKWDSKVTSKRNYSSTGYTTTGSSSKNVYGTSLQSGRADRQWADDFTDPSGTHARFMNRPSTGGTARNIDGLLAWKHVDEIQTRPSFPAKTMVIQKTVDWTVEYELNTNAHTP
ncbi:hypothetical protein MAC_08922 [Metarhizium acridum CQMa 102]|uniref:Rhodopsin domain-containing protein n=1 Tax=Metarhizium acridum (strain CQMa 102) TaxID=655827 RepID=E9EGC4_METAQ|nr:uncharacterized protein MAC_08922 [Metarhizium acridum CQMa 102]EFY85039.1 hypothetical protein MAC_08922 [Metarhizium acridum CQMa 102]